MSKRSLNSASPTSPTDDTEDTYVAHAPAPMSARFTGQALIYSLREARAGMASARRTNMAFRDTCASIDAKGTKVHR